MNLFRLSLFSVAICLAGLVVLLVGTLDSIGELHEHEASEDRLLALRARIDDFNATSDRLLLNGADADAWRAYRVEAQAIGTALEQLGERHPDARRAARHVAAMAATVRAAPGTPAAQADSPGPGPNVGPLDVPASSRAVMNQVADLGTALDAALTEALRQRQEAVAQEGTRIAYTLGASALVFGLLSIFAFGMMYRRIARPARALSQTLAEVRSGHSDARVSISGSDELAHVGQTLNALLDEQRAALQAIEERQQHLESALTELGETRDRLLRAQRVANIGHWEADPESGRLEWSDQVFEIFGTNRADFAGTVEAFYTMVHPDDRERLSRAQAAWLEHGGNLDAEHRIVRPDGQVRWVHERARVLAGPDGQPRRTVGTVQDITERHRLVEQLQMHDAALRESRDALEAALTTRQALINSLPAHIAMLDAEGIVVDVNDQWRHFGEQNDSADEAFGVGSNYLAVCDAASGECGEEAARVAEGLREVLSAQKESFTLEYPCHAPDKPRWFRVMFTRLLPEPGQHAGAVAMHVDVTERKLAEQELKRLAYTDPLTGLASRNGFEKNLRNHFEKSGWQSDDFVAMVDVVNLRDINDAHGYETGDHLLIELGRRLQACTGDTGVAGRTGGDEFVVYVAPGAGQTQATVLQQFDRITEEAFELDGIAIEVELRIGYTELGDRQRPPEDLMREAELALSEKRENLEARRRWVRYSEAMAERTLQRIRLTTELRHALEAGEFELHFQPKVNLADGRMIAAEALLRWHHPERGLQPPGLFIPVAERSQLIGPIGDWALREACRQLREWHDAGLDIVCISVNVSLIQFQLGSFPARVRAALEAFDIAPSELSLEITESVFESHSDQLLAEIRELHDLGVRLSLDDFGTGYSSLQYLNRYPFDEVKIDRAFVSKLLDEHFSRDIVRSVMRVADALGAEVVAEGIETPDIARALLELGCNIGQGFYYSMPLEAEDFRWLLDNHSTLPLDSGARDAARRPDPRAHQK